MNQSTTMRWTDRARTQWADPRARRTILLWLAVLLSLAVHVAILLVPAPRHHLEQKVSGPGTEGPLKLSLAPKPTPVPQQQAEPPPPPEPQKAKPIRSREPTHAPPPAHVIAVAPRNNATPPTLVVPPANTAVVPPPDDFTAHVQANQARRNEQEAADHAAYVQASPPVEDANARANRIAKANVASSQGRANGTDEDDTGGLFKIDFSGYETVQFSFFGWNRDFRRNWSQQYVVRRGSDPDIHVAVVKKMIEIIREYKKEDFVWNSHRLHRPVTLSARPADDKELQQFLMQEFYP